MSKPSELSADAATGWHRVAADAVARMRAAAERAAFTLADIATDGHRLSMSLLDEHQQTAYELAFLSAETTAAELLLEYARLGEDERLVAQVAIADLARSARARMDACRQTLGVGRDLEAESVVAVVEAGTSPDVLAALALRLGEIGSGRPHLADDIDLVADSFRRFAEDRIAPHAAEIHRRNLDVPEDIIRGLGDLGAFGMSIPSEYGGSLEPESPATLAMVVATEELSRVSLGAGGSLITRPEILARALLDGGTEQQKNQWLPAIASGDKMVAVAVTEPDVGSDVAAITTAAERRPEGFVINGSKMWATFAGRAELLMLLARTDPDPSLGHRGLSLFLIEKPPFAGHSFQLETAPGGRFSGRAIDTIGYRGMHSYELTFADWPVPADALIGGDAGLGRGFYLQMGAFASGRLQTAARAVGVMQGAFDEALRYARDRNVFGRPLIEFELTQVRLARMAARIQANRRLTYHAAALLSTGGGDIEAAMAKALASRAAEEISRDAVQIHGGYGYAEEYPVSRHFVDARVLSIFEGTEEVLALRVIARQLVENAAATAPADAG